MISIQHVDKAFNGNPVLQDVSFDIPDGQIFGVFGKSGIGKSTLAKVLCGVCPPDAGAVTLDGQTLVSADHPYDRRLGIRIQMVYQQPYATLDPSQKIGAGFTELIRYHRFRPKGEELSLTKEMLDKAKAGKYAVGHFNINNLEWTKAILLTAQELNSPVILGVSEGAGKYMTGFKTVATMVKAMDEGLGITVPVALHLDHGTYEGCYKCIKAGFTSIMFDGSHYPIEENVAKTKELVNVAHALGLSIEAEVGAIGGEEDGVVGMGECADPDECKAVADLGVTMLAAGIGNIHGKYPANWPGLSFETLAAVKEKVGDMPLVLHGGTGIPADMIKKAISLGVAKINVNTECQLAFQEATRKYIEEGKDQQGKGFDPRKLLAPGAEAIKATVKEKMELFGSVGKAND